MFDDIVILYEDSLNAEAWEKFISSLKEREWENRDRKTRTRTSRNRNQNLTSGFQKSLRLQSPPLERRRTLLSGRYRWVALMGAIVVVLGAITLAIWRIYLKPDPGDVASIEKMAFPLPDNPLSPCFRLLI